MSHRLLILALCLALPATLFAQDVSPQAKELFAKMISAAQAKNWGDAMNNLKQAYAADPKIMALSDNGAMEQMQNGLKAEASAKPNDVQTGKNLGWLMAVRGDFQGGLDAYRKIAAAAGDQDQEVKDQIRTLTAYVGGGGGGTTTASTGTTGAGGGGSSGSAGGGGGGGGDGTTPTSSDPNAGGGENPEVKSLKEQLTKKDEEIENINKEKEELTKKVAELEAEIKSLQIYKTRINQAGGLR